MKRLSAFVSKAGDMVQQASDELQRRQQEQQYKQTSSTQGLGYPSQQQYQSHSSQYQYHPQHQATPPLPPRQNNQQTQGVVHLQTVPETVHHHQNQPSYHQYQQPYSPHTPLASPTGAVTQFPPPPPVTVHQVPTAQETVASPEARIQRVQEHYEWELLHEKQRAQEIQREFQGKLENHRLEGERLQSEYDKQMERSRQATEQLHRDMSDKLEIERQRAKPEAVRISVEAEEERATVEQARITAVRAEAEARAYEQNLLEARKLAAEQEEQDKRRAAELAAKYQAEYEEDLRQRLAAVNEAEKRRQHFEQQAKQEEIQMLEEAKRREEQLAAKYQAEYEERLRQAVEGVTKIDLAKQEAPSESLNVAPRAGEGVLAGKSDRLLETKPPVPPKPVSWQHVSTPGSPNAPVDHQDTLLVVGSGDRPSAANQQSLIETLPSLPPPPPLLSSKALLNIHPTPLPLPYSLLDTSTAPAFNVAEQPLRQQDGASWPAYGMSEVQQPAPPPPPPSQPASNIVTSRAHQPSALPDKYPSVMHPCGVIPLTECLDRPLAINVDWFVHDSAPLFTICSRCYVDHIYDTQFRQAFANTRYDDAEQVARGCLFGTHRILRQLWPQALTSGSLKTMIGFMQTRPQVGTCPEQSNRKGMNWYVNPDMPDASFCCACFEDRIAAGPFASRFRMEMRDTDYNCDLGRWYIKRMYDAKIGTNDWAGWVAEVNARLKLPVCKKMTKIITAEGAWYGPSQPGWDETLICSSCFVDYFCGHSYESDFVPRVREDYILRACVFGYLNLESAARNASQKDDASIFWRAINKIKTQEVCDTKGITGGTWYTTPNDPDQFGICGGCFHGIVETGNGGHHFVPKPGVSPDVSLFCCLNPDFSRFQEYMLRLTETLLTNSWKPLGVYASKYAKINKCLRRKTQKEAKWWGFDRLCICEECYVSFAKGTSLEAQFKANGEIISEPRLCELYSPRMRSMYMEVCEGKKDLEEFLDFAEHRMVVFGQTVPRCEFLMFQQEMAAQNSQFYGLLGAFYTGIGGMQEISSGHTYTVGNSYAGHGYANENSLQGAVYTNQALEAGATVTNPSPIMEVGMLEQKWLAVE